MKILYKICVTLTVLLVLLWIRGLLVYSSFVFSSVFYILVTVAEVFSLLMFSYALFKPIKKQTQEIIVYSAFGNLFIIISFTIVIVYKINDLGFSIMIFCIWYAFLATSVVIFINSVIIFSSIVQRLIPKKKS